MDLTDKNVIYVGGFGGIGQRCTREFLAKGIKHLVIFDLKENVEQMQQMMASYPNAKIHFVPIDLTKKESIETAYKIAKEQIGHFDVVVNGSGLMDDSNIDLCLQINFIGVVHSTMTAFQYMDKNAGGRGGFIVNISSVAGLEPSAMFTVYSTAKFGVTALTRNMSNPYFYAHTGVGFITICPGFTDTHLLDKPSDKVTFPFCTVMSERFMRVKRQPAEVCAANLVKAVEAGKNGAVWLLELGEMQEVEFPVFWRPTFVE